MLIPDEKKNKIIVRTTIFIFIFSMIYFLMESRLRVNTTDLSEPSPASSKPHSHDLDSSLSSATEQHSPSPATQPQHTDSSDTGIISNSQLNPRSPASLPAPDLNTSSSNTDETIRNQNLGPKGDILQDFTSPRQADGSYEHLQLLKTEMKYPLVLVQEIYKRDENNPDEDILVEKMAMVADHVRISFDEHLKKSEEEVRKLATSVGGQLRKVGFNGQYYLISFEATHVHSLKEMTQHLQAIKEIKYIEPDYIVSSY